MQNRDISVLIPLDSLFDYRQGLICKLISKEEDDLAQRLVDSALLWDEHIKDAYANRVYDKYDYPALGLTEDKFEQAYAQRSIDDFAFYTPSNLLKVLLKSVLEVETDYDQTRNISSFTWTINTFPYQLDDDYREIIRDSIEQRFGKRYVVKFIHADESLATPSFYSSFNYVFKYDLLLSKNNERFMKHLATEPIPDVVFFVPDLFIKREEFITGKPIDVINAFAYALGNNISIRAVPHAFYDCE